MQKQYTYLALGDSYTIGEAVPVHKNFPYQTVQLLRKEGHDVAAPEIIAQTGWTANELQNALQGYSFAQKYDFVTLLIGVNNQYRGQQIILYKEQFEALLKKSIDLAGGKKEHVFVISIPDYSTTPFAQTGNPQKISKEIDEYNKLSKAICIQYKVPYIDTSDSPGEKKEAANLVAKDGLHPSESEYARWAKKLAGAFGKLLKK